jgi:hypothetical protein
VLVAAALYVGRGVRSSPRVRGDGSGEEDWLDIFACLCDCDFVHANTILYCRDSPPFMLVREGDHFHALPFFVLSTGLL